MTEDRETIPFYDLPWPQRLDFIVETMREMSSQIDPQEMVETYGRRVRYMSPADRRISISRRDLKPPEYRITRSGCVGWAGQSLEKIAAASADDRRTSRRADLCRATANHP